MTGETLSKTDKTTMRRVRERAEYDRDTINSIIDDALLCHVAYVVDGEPYCTPTLCWREGDYIYWHGSSISKFLNAALGNSVCLTVSHLDGLVLARSAFHHSVNYRSVMLFGAPELVEEPHKSEALERMVEYIVPGRWDSLRPMTKKEANATTVLRMKIDEGVAKVRKGGPKDDRRDYDLPIWAGVIPTHMSYGPVEDDPLNTEGVDRPDHIRAFEAREKLAKEQN